MAALVAQLSSPNEDLRQVSASVLRNLSWRADLASKKTLREVGCVTALTCACMETSKESTLKSILSALWNLSAHCSENKADVCAVDSALAFLVATLGYKSPTKTLAIIENGGGILRNVSSHIAVREDYRQVLRKHGCLAILLKHLRSPSLTIVSNACGTLWNISARCPEDQRVLWEMGAVSMLRNLVHSKHKMISMGSAAALKNLISAKSALGIVDGDRFSKSNVPGLHVRKQRALEAELASQDLAETCENMESPQSSPTETRKYEFNNMRPKCGLQTENNGVFQSDEFARLHQNALLHGHRSSSSDRSPLVESNLNMLQEKSVSRSSSQDSIGSVHSDISHDRAPQHAMVGRSGKLRLDRHVSNALGDHKKNGQALHPNSRIMQVMQEVAMHAGIDAGPYVKDYRCESHSADNTPPSVRKQGNNRASTGGRSQIPLVHRSKEFSRRAGEQPSGESRLNSSLQFQNTFANVTQRIEDMCRDGSEPEQDEPINYSIKYSETPQTVPSSPAESAFVKPLPKTGAFTRSMPFSTRDKRLTVKSALHSEDDTTDAATNGYTKPDPDMETMDQPTDYSIRFAEHDDDNTFTDQPINYSTRYSEGDDQSCDDDVAPQRPGMFESCVNDDNVRTYCTEGTPLTYLSTATSSTDLSRKPGNDNRPAPGVTRLPGQRASVVHPQKPDVCLSNACSESEHMSGTSSHSTGQNTGSTVILKNSPPGGGSMPREDKCSPLETKPLSQPPSLYSYNDSSTSGSPSEKLTKYSTEGTPLCFSRVSSLSSLHSSDALDSPPPAALPVASPAANQNRPDVVLQSIDENRSLDVSANSQNDVTLKNDDTFNSGNTTLSHAPPATGGATKSVTFDETNQVEETPLMFSRSSSLGSLSSFDTHSVHSSVVSEYSRRASEVVSPSDLPDSPSETMPPSPSHRTAPPRIDSGDRLKLAPGAHKIIKSMATKAPAGCDRGKTPGKDSSGSDHSVAPFTAETLVSYAVEDFPSGALSTVGSSLSALTIDDEPRILKEPDLRCVPLGKEHDTPPEINTTGSVSSHENLDATVITVKEVDLGATAAKPDDKVDEDDDNDSVSEGEEEMIAACISMGMPASSKRRMRKSSSENSMKRRLAYSSGPSGARIAGMENVTPLRTSTSFHGTGLQDSFDAGGDSVCRFATEDTPHNFSSATSLSNMSLDLSDDESEVNKGSHNVHGQSHSHTTARGNSLLMDDAKSDFSSFSEDNEDLLSEAIQSAMPKSKKSSRRSTEHNRSATVHDLSSRRIAPSGNLDVAGPMFTSDTVKTYSVEDVPKGSAMCSSDGRNMGSRINAEPEPFHPDVPTNIDSPRLFAVEGTPMSFSCNDSFSSISCDEDTDLPDDAFETKHDTMPADEAMSCMTPHSKLFTPRKPGIQSPLIARLKCTPLKRLASEPSMHSTPLSKAEHLAGCHDDSPTMYVVEGTPTCFSRNSSLSSLDSDDHEALANHNADVDPAAAAHDGDANATFGVEDTPANFSANSSLSSLSVESLSFEPTESESAQLEECINAAMPKGHGRKRKDTRLPLPPSGSSRSRPSPQDSSASKDATVHQSSDNPSKNVQGPQVRREGGRLQVDEGGQRMETPSLSLMQKQCKDATNREKLHGSARTCATGSLSSSDNRYGDEEVKPGTHVSTEQETFVADMGLKSAITDEMVVFSLEALGAVDDGSDEHNGRTRNRSPPSEEHRGRTRNISPPSEEYSGKTCNARDVDLEKIADTVDDGNFSDCLDDDNEAVGDVDDGDYAAGALQLVQSNSDDECEGDESEIPIDMVERDIDAHSSGDDYDAAEIPPEILESATRLAERMAQSTDSVLSLQCHLTSSMTGSLIMKESFPDMSSSLVSDITTPTDEDGMRNPLGGGREDVGDTSAEGGVDRSCDSEFVDDEEMYETVLERCAPGDAIVDISTEEERALEENISIILSEMSLTRQLSTSTLGDDDGNCDDEIVDGACIDKDFFIENETLSLVSNDYLSDAVSDVSMTLSTCSRTVSEQRSDATYDLSGSHEYSDNESEVAAPGVVGAVTGAVMRKGPKIVKSIDSSKQMQQEEVQEPANGAIKVVRGRKPPLSASRVTRSVTSSATKTIMTMSKLSPGGPRGKPQGTPKKPASPVSVNLTSSKPQQKASVQSVIQPRGAARQTVRSPAPKTPPRTSSISTTRAGASRLASPRTPPIKTSPTKPSSRVQPTSRTPMKKTTPVASVQKASAKGAPTKTSPRTGIKPSGLSPRSLPSLTKSSLPVTAKTGGSMNPGVKCPTSVASVKGNTTLTPANRVICAGAVVVERPKPPVKQGTFVKKLTADDDVNKSVDDMSDDTDHNGNDVPLVEGGVQASSNRKSTEFEDQEKGICEGRLTKVPLATTASLEDVKNVQRSTSEHSQASWSNALGGHSFVVDTSQEEGFSAPYKQLQVRRNSNKPPCAMATRTIVTKTVVVKSSGVPGGRSLLAKKSSGPLNKSSGSLNKSSSGNSLNKSSGPLNKSSGSLNKCSSGNSLNKSSRSIPGARTPVRTSLDKSDSASSVCTTSRSSTPNGRRQSPAGSASSECSSSSTLTNKKPAVSKIASLWKRDGQKSGNAKLTPVKCKTEPVKSVAPFKRISLLKNTRRSLPVSTAFCADSPVMECDTAEPSARKESLSKSSTYEKLSMDVSTAELSEAGSDETESGAVPRNPPSNGNEQSKMWRRTYTVDAQDVADAERANDSKKVEATTGRNKKTSIWRRPKTKSTKSEPKIEQKSEHSKKRFSLWRRETHEGAKSDTKANGTACVSKIPGLLSSETRNLSGEHVVCGTEVERCLLQRGEEADNTTLNTVVINSATRPSSLTPLLSPPRQVQNAAIVPPFNYTPARSTTVADTNSTTVVDADPKQPVAPSRPTTKTEMLMARRRSYLNSLKSESSDETTDHSKRSSCLVTTV